MSGLIERIEAANGACVEIDAAIELATGRWTESHFEAWKGWHEWHESADPQSPVPVPPQRYTASLDDAMTLVPDGCGWIAGWGQVRADEPMGGARISRNARFIGHRANYDTIAEAEASTPALALVAASLRARETTPSIKGDAS